MPWTNWIDTDQRLIYTRMSDVIAYPDLLAAQNALRDHADFDPIFPLLLDLRPATDLNVSYDDLRAVVRTSPLAVETRRAILVNGVAMRSLVELYELVRANESRIASARGFRDWHDAVAWLGRPGLQRRHLRLVTSAH